MEIDGTQPTITEFKPVERPVHKEVKTAPVEQPQESAPVEVQLSTEKVNEAEKSTTNLKKLKITDEDIQKTIDTANKKIQPVFCEFNYKVHAKTNQLIISVINTKTKEVIREIPPERALDALAKMWELAGILVDTKG